MTNIMHLFEMILGYLFPDLNKLMWFVVSGCLDTNSGQTVLLNATRPDWLRMGVLSRLALTAMTLLIWLSNLLPSG